jgi:hypothetical protein
MEVPGNKGIQKSAFLAKISCEQKSTKKGLLDEQ